VASLLVITAATIHRVWRALIAAASTADTTIFEEGHWPQRIELWSARGGPHRVLTNLYGRATTADFNTAASRRLSIFGRNMHRLDLDAMAIRETGRCIDLSRGAASLLSRR
jgi:hypothetical protein